MRERNAKSGPWVPGDSPRAVLTRRREVASLVKINEQQKEYRMSDNTFAELCLCAKEKFRKLLFEQRGEFGNSVIERHFHRLLAAETPARILRNPPAKLDRRQGA